MDYSKNSEDSIKVSETQDKKASPNFEILSEDKIKQCLEKIASRANLMYNGDSLDDFIKQAEETMGKVPVALASIAYPLLDKSVISEDLATAYTVQALSVFDGVFLNAYNLAYPTIVEKIMPFRVQIPDSNIWASLVAESLGIWCGMLLQDTAIEKTDAVQPVLAYLEESKNGFISDSKIYIALSNL